MRKKKKGKIVASHTIPEDTYIQVPGTVVVAAAATISDRRIRSGPLPRIIILLLHPCKHWRKSAILYYEYRGASGGTILIASLERPPAQPAVNRA